MEYYVGIEEDGMSGKKYWPDPRPNLRVGKWYRFCEIVERKNGDGPFKGKIIARYTTFYLVSCENYITTIHVNSIGIDIEAVEI